MECPKPHRVEDESAKERCRSYGFCMLQDKNCNGGLDVHHIKSRGSGGGDTDDNLILLCRFHHQMAHNGSLKKSYMYEVRIQIEQSR